MTKSALFTAKSIQVIDFLQKKPLKWHNFAEKVAIFPFFVDSDDSVVVVARVKVPRQLNIYISTWIYLLIFRLISNKVRTTSHFLQVGSCLKVVTSSFTGYVVEVL